MIDSRDTVDPALLARAQGSGARILLRLVALSTTSGKRLRAIDVLTGGARAPSIEADTLAVSGGWYPNVDLTCHLGSRPEWNEDIAAFVPDSAARTCRAPAPPTAHSALRDCLARRQPRPASAAAEDLRHRSNARCTSAAADDEAYRLSAVLACRGIQGKGLRRPPERRHGQGYRARPARRLSLRRASEALHHARHGDRPGQDLQRDRPRHHGGADRQGAFRRPARRSSGRPMFRSRSAPSPAITAARISARPA